MRGIFRAGKAKPRRRRWLAQIFDLTKPVARGDLGILWIPSLAGGKSRDFNAAMAEKAPQDCLYLEEV